MISQFIRILLPKLVNDFAIENESKAEKRITPKIAKIKFQTNKTEKQRPLSLYLPNTVRQTTAICSLLQNGFENGFRVQCIQRKFNLTAQNIGVIVIMRVFFYLPKAHRTSPYQSGNTIKNQ